MDVPQQHDLEDDGNEDDDEDSEEDGLVVEDGDGLRGGADAAEPVELTHFRRRVEGCEVNGGRWRVKRYARGINKKVSGFACVREKESDIIVYDLHQVEWEKD